MKDKHSKKRVTEAEFAQIKTLMQLGRLGHEDIMEITGRSSRVIRFIKQSDTLADYERTMREYNDKYKGEPVKRYTEKQIKEQFLPAERTNDDALERIAVAMERLAEAWEDQPKRRGFFG